jgi:hypothetical protein
LPDWTNKIFLDILSDKDLPPAKAWDAFGTSVGARGDVELPHPPRDQRITFDPETCTVVFDGSRYPIGDSKTFALYQAIADNRPLPITRAELRTR